MTSFENRLTAMCGRVNARADVSELSVRVTDRSGDIDVAWSAPGARATHCIASSTKPFAAALILRRVASGELDLAQPLVSIVPRDELAGLNRVGGTDRADELTLRDVLAHTSGIPNYYAAKALDPNSDIAAVTAADPGWSYSDALEIARGMEAKFAPHSGRAEYSFTNYQLVTRVIEVVTGVTLAEALAREIIEPMGLRDTALLTPASLELFDDASPILHGRQSYRGARRLASLGAEGALVSSTADTMRFLRAMLDGEALGDGMLQRALSDRLPIFPGASYGLGVMALTLPRLLTGLPRPGLLIGHAGMTGHFMFGDPVSGLAAVGTTNQLADPRRSIRVLIGALRAARSVSRG